MAQTEDSVYKACIAKLSAPKEEDEKMDCGEFSPEDAVGLDSDHPQGDLSHPNATRRRSLWSEDENRTPEDQSLDELLMGSD